MITFHDWITDPDRYPSAEVDFGAWWTKDGNPTGFPRYRVSWIEHTGELYAVEQSKLQSFQILATFPTRKAVEQAMNGWAEDACPFHNSLSALKAHLASGATWQPDKPKPRCRPSDFEDGVMSHMPIQRSGVVMLRMSGFIATNVPHLVTHHSPSGYEWGYAGSGPADLALNILENVLKIQGYEGPRQKCWKGTCFQRAWAMHQEFKFDFLATIEQQDSVTIPYDTITAWIAAHQPD